MSRQTDVVQGLLVVVRICLIKIHQLICPDLLALTSPQPAARQPVACLALAVRPLFPSHKAKRHSEFGMGAWEMGSEDGS